MINSLANFLMIVIYHGNYSGNVSWILMCYTMGATALARVTIEESRERASAYAVALGGATFYVLTRFVHDPVFLIAVILTIGYLADRVVHDCTIIDDGVDSSGQGLVDSARRWFQRRSPHLRADETPSSGWRPRSPKTKPGHQPGRTVLYLAVGALPLFGIGQFFIGSSPSSWERAKWMLTIYLFTSLSLLVVTSFLNLRRYLRQRGTEMSLQVTVAWLAGGIGMILFILLVACLAPMPGQTLVSWRIPDFLTDTKSTTASRWGWGKDGADEAGENAPASGAPRADAQKPDDAPKANTTNQPDAKPGGETGSQPHGPAGKESGGNKPAKQSPTPGEAGKSKQLDRSSDAGKSSQSPQPPQSQTPDKPSAATSPPDANPQPSEPSQTPADADAPPQPNPPEPNRPQPNQPQPNQPQPNRPQPNPPQSTEPPDTAAESKPDQAQQNDAKPPQTPGESKPSEQKMSESELESPPPPKPSGNFGGAVAGLFKFILFFALLVIIAVYVYLYRDAWLAWLHGWLTGRDSIDPITPGQRRQAVEGPPARPFASFTNPIGTAEAGQVVVVTFQALEAWGREQGVRRGEDETPSEYVRRLAARFPTLQQPARRVVDAYNRVVYGRTPANRADVTAASSVWQIMRPQL